MTTKPRMEACSPVPGSRVEPSRRIVVSISRGIAAESRVSRLESGEGRSEGRARANPLTEISCYSKDKKGADDPI
jgi:hypothetical protein